MKYVKGNLIDMAFNGEFDIIIHGCNIHNTMGSGIAREIRERIPGAWKIDQATVAGDMTKLGLFTRYTQQRGFVGSFEVINAYTQPTFGQQGLNVCYDSIERVFKLIKLMYDLNPNVTYRVGIPKIGAGLGGGDWEKIEALINSAGISDITCVELPR